MAQGKTELSINPSEQLFFADSDDDVTMEEAHPERLQPFPVPVSPSEPASAKRLFFADSEDEDAAEIPLQSFATPQKKPIFANHKDESDTDIEIPSFEDGPRASSVSSMSSDAQINSSPGSSPKTIHPPAKKRRLSPPAQATSPSPAPFSSAYLGSFLVGNAWSTVKGKGYVKSGDQIKVERDELDEVLSSKAVSSNKVLAKTKKSNGQDKGKKKQLSIANMLKAQPLKASKKKTNSVVRLTNSRGFG